MDLISHSLLNNQSGASSDGAGMSSNLAECFVRLNEVSSDSFVEFVVPECLKPLIMGRDVFALPSGTGHTEGYFFASSRKSMASQTTPLVLLGHGLGQSPCESNWVWIGAFLNAGYDVLVWALDGHSKGLMSTFDTRLSSRTLGLILDRISRKAPDLELHVVGYGLSASYALLIGMRPNIHKGIRSLVLVNPSLEPGQLTQSVSLLQMLSHPIQFLKSCLKLTKYYGFGSFRRLWVGESVRDLKKRTFSAVSIELQMKGFLESIPCLKDIVSQVKVRALFIVSNNDSKHFLQAKGECQNSKVYFEFDEIHGPRGIQYVTEWPEKALLFMKDLPENIRGSEENLCEAVR